MESPGSLHALGVFLSSEGIMFLLYFFGFFLFCKQPISVVAGLIYKQYLEVIGIPGQQIPLAMPLPQLQLINYLKCGFPEMFS